MRYVVLGILLLFISISSVIAINAYFTADSTIEQLKNDFGSIVTINKLYGKALMQDDIDIIIDTGLISDKTDFIYSYIITNASFSDGTDLINSFKYLFNVFLQGGVSSDLINIVEGRMYVNENECVISKNIINNIDNSTKNLKIGEKLSVYDNISGMTNNLIIVGIVNDELLYGTYKNNFNGVIYTTLSSALNFTSVDNTSYGTNSDKDIVSGYSNSFKLKSYNHMESLKNKIGNILDDNGEYVYSITYTKDGFYNLINPLRETMRICTLFTMIIIILALFVIVIVTILGFSERRYDIGVLRCVGMSKPRIISLFTLETLLFVTAVMLVGLLFGSLLSGIFTDGLSAGRYKADYFAVLAQTGVRVLLAGLALSLLSSLMSAVFILRYQPMKILRNRN